MIRLLRVNQKCIHPTSSCIRVTFAWYSNKNHSNYFKIAICPFQWQCLKCPASRSSSRSDSSPWQKYLGLSSGLTPRWIISSYAIIYTYIEYIYLYIYIYIYILQYVYIYIYIYRFSFFIQTISVSNHVPILDGVSPDQSIQWHPPWQLWWSSLDPSSWASAASTIPKGDHVYMFPVSIYLMGFYGGLMGFYGGFMGLNAILWWFHGI